MKIAYFTDTFLPQLNGVATSVNNFYQEIKKINPDIEIIAPKIKDYQDNDKNILRLSSSKVWPTIPDSARIPLPLNKEWTEILLNDYEIIHAHGNGFFSLLGLLIARQKRIPFVLTFHTFMDQYGHYFLGGKVLTPELINKLLSTFANRCTHIITPSLKMKNLLIRYGVKKPITVIPNFVDLKKFQQPKSNFLHQKLNLTNNEKILLAVGRLGKEKNFEFLIRMFSLLNHQITTTHLVIVGEGNNKKRLESQIKKLNLQNFVHLIGSIPSENMPQVYNDSDIFVFASTSEVHPMVAIEAAASGLPLVVVKDEAYLDIVENNNNGFLTKNSTKEFSEKVQQLLDNPNLRKKMGNNSKAIISKQLVKEKISEDLINLYRQLLKRSSPKN